MIKNSYSQLKQDVFVDRVLRQEKGFFIETGCGDGHTLSNTLALEEIGWNGILIDIDRDLLEKCLKCRDKNSIILKLDLSLVSLRDVLAAFNAPKIIDYLSIDIDDYSLAPLVGFPFEEYDVKVITFEHDAYRFGSQLKTPSRKFLKEKGFKLVCKNVASVVFEEANPAPYSLASPQEDWYVNTNLVPEENWINITPELINQQAGGKDVGLI